MNEGIGKRAMAVSSKPDGASAARVALALGALLAAMLLWAVPAQAYEGFEKFEMSPSTPQAGGHPDVTIHLEWENSEYHNGAAATPSNPCICDDPKIVTQEFPTGFVGNPHAVPVCEIIEFSFGRCPPASQVGKIDPTGFFGWAPLYNVQPHPEEPALTGFTVPFIAAPVFISLSSRTESDYGLNAESSPIYHPLPALHKLTVELWGVPASEVHKGWRFRTPLNGLGTCSDPAFCEFSKTTGAEANVPEVPYLENPTSCGETPLESRAWLLYYTGGLVRTSAPWPATTGCQQLTFDPSLTVEPTTNQADAPAGVNIDLVVPQKQSADTPSPSEIRSSTTVLPEGFTINSSAADGKVTCSDAQTAIGTRRAAECPEASKIGTLTVDSSGLPAPIPGSIYLGEPKPGHPYRLVLTASGWGTNFKLVGSARTDPGTGQLTFEFNELPQTPITELSMHYFGSERGLMATPTQCGEYPVESEFVPWDSALPNQTSVSSFNVTSGPNGQPCPGLPRPFSPRFKAGTSNSTAGRHAPLTLEFSRSDGDQNLSTFGITGAAGLLATLKGIPYCSDAAIAQAAAAARTGMAELSAPSCPAASQIGTAVTGAGAGTHQVYVNGAAYLAGPYKGAPLSIVVITPTISGPYDLGNVVIRTAVGVNPVTAQITAASDQVPQILGGVPLRIRSIRLNLDRPGFMLNPTNCDPSSIASTIGGSEGSVAASPTGFQVSDCANLPYEPKLSLRLSGGVNRRGHPAIHTLLRTAEGEANSGRVVVTLPKGEQVDNAHLRTICTRPQFAANACPPESLVGEAQARTPLLDRPISGDVYLRSSDNKLPDLAVKLHGQIDIELDGRIDTTKGGSLRTTFENLPDAPVGAFALNLLGGKKGIVVNSESLCSNAKPAIVKMTGQNGAVFKRKAKLQAPCGSKGKHKRARGRHRHGRKAVH